MGREIYYAIVRKACALDRGLARSPAEMDVAGRHAEFRCHRLQLIGRVGKPRQGFREPVAIDTGATPELAVGARLPGGPRGLLRLLLLRARRSFLLRRRARRSGGLVAEHRIAKPDEW